jgi:hypothetical protein
MGRWRLLGRYAEGGRAFSHQDWATSGADNSKISEGYQQSVAAFNALHEQFEDFTSGTAKMAKTILQISKVPDPPLRLLVLRRLPLLSTLPMTFLSRMRTGKPPH